MILFFSSINIEFSIANRQTWMLPRASFNLVYSSRMQLARLATEDGQPVGYAQLFPSWSSVSMQRVWILNDLFVLPKYRNQGVAKALMSKAKEYAISTDAVRIILATEATNKIGQKLYESIGYRKIDDFYHYVLKTAP